MNEKGWGKGRDGKGGLLLRGGEGRGGGRGGRRGKGREGEERVKAPPRRNVWLRLCAHAPPGCTKVNVTAHRQRIAV